MRRNQSSQQTAFGEPLNFFLSRLLKLETTRSCLATSTAKIRS